MSNREFGDGYGTIKDYELSPAGSGFEGEEGTARGYQADGISVPLSCFWLFLWEGGGGGERGEGEGRGKIGVGTTIAILWYYI